MKKVRNIIALVFVLLLALTIVLLIVLLNQSDKKFSITTSEQFIQAMKHSADIKKRKEYTLDTDIAVNANALPKTALDFYGILNGNGHTLTISANKKSTLPKPLFKTIKEDAAINMLNIVVDSKVTVGSESGKSDVAVLANVNSGVISDCTLTVDAILIGKECSNAAALVNFNYKEIKNVCVTVLKMQETKKNESWSCRFGAVSTVNYASVKDVFVDVSFDNGAGERLSVFDSAIDNRYVGYVVGGFEAAETTEKTETTAATSVFQNIIIITKKDESETFRYWTKAADSKVNAPYYERRAYRDMSTIWNSIQGRWQNWELKSNDSLPVLKKS